MSDPVIGIGHPVSDPPVPGSCAAHVRPADPDPHGAVFGILHMPYGIRNSEFQNRESGIWKSVKLWREDSSRSDAFRSDPRKHWSG